MPHIALATCYEHANLIADEAPLVQALEQQGITVTPAVWNSPEIAWNAYDFILIRNIWDYYRQPQTFVAWLDYLKAKNLRVYNPLPLLRWNMNKIYLSQLAKAGIPILPTVFVQHIGINLAQTLADKGWHDVVIKPLISASGENTWRINPATAAEHQFQFDFIQQRFGGMIQPYAEQIAQEGEYSLIFFNGEYSHAVLKRPAPDSLFVQAEHGGSTVLTHPMPQTIAQARAVLEATHNLTGIMPLYARVDGFLGAGNFVLMELECIEPELFMLYGDGVGERFAAAIQAL